MYLRTLFYLSRRCSVSYLSFMKQQSLHSYSVEKKYFPSLIFTNWSKYSSDSPLKCWNCNFVYKQDLFCSKCKVLQELPEDLTYYDIIGLPKSYNVSAAEVQMKYRELQKLLHPDKYTNKSEKEKELSANLSSLVNKAYSTLSHPLKRGLYILKLNGITISEETQNMNPEFLIKIMEKNEEIEDALNDQNKIEKLVEENESVLNSLSMEVADAFNKNNIKEAKFLLIQMKYYDSINNRLKKLKHDLGIVK